MPSLYAPEDAFQQQPRKKNDYLAQMLIGAWGKEDIQGISRTVNPGDPTRGQWVAQIP